MTREQLKSLTLVALFGLCTILVSQIWNGVSITRLKSTADFFQSSYATEQISKLIYPQSYVINFGGGSHTAMFSDSYGIWLTAKPGIHSFISGKSTEKQITKDEWQEKNRFRSVRFEFPVSLTPDQFLQLSGSDSIYSGKITAMDSILISTTEPEALYIGDEASGHYYVLIGKPSSIDIESRFKEVERGAESEFETVEEHYRIKEILKTPEVAQFNENTVMVPRFEIKPRPILRIRGELPESYGTEEAQTLIRKMADNIFGNQFAFVNRLVDVNGAIVFLYGYGEKTFRVHPNGVMDYQEKPDPVLISKKIDFLNALNQSIAFIGRMGEFPEGLFLSGYSQTPNKLGYRFFFSYPLEGIPVVSSIDRVQDEAPLAQAPIEIEIQGEQVIFCQRRIGSVEALLDVTPLWDRVLSLDEIIVKNYDRILPVYMSQSGESVMDSSIQYRLLQSIRSVRLVYCQNNAGDRMTPAWEIDFDGVMLYFNVYDGRMMAQSF